MGAPYLVRLTRLHPALWAPYKIIAYPHGFAGAPGEPDLPPVWTGDARVVGTAPYQRGHACLQLLPDADTLDGAISECWAHYASLHGEPAHA